MTVLDIYNIFCKAYNKFPQIIYKKNKKNDIGISISDISRLKREISIKYSKKKIDDLAKSSIKWFLKKSN